MAFWDKDSEFRVFFDNVKDSWRIIRKKEFSEKFDRRKFNIVIVLGVISAAIFVFSIIDALGFFF